MPRINVIARTNELPNNRLVKAAQQMGYDVASHSSNFPDDDKLIDELIEMVLAEETDHAPAPAIEAEVAEEVTEEVTEGDEHSDHYEASDLEDYFRCVLSPGGEVETEIRLDDNEVDEERPYAGMNFHGRSRAPESNKSQAVFLRLFVDGTVKMSISEELEAMGIVPDEATNPEVSSAVNRMRNRLIKGGSYQDIYEGSQGTDVFTFVREGMSLVVTYQDATRPPAYLKGERLTVGGKALRDAISEVCKPRSEFAQTANGVERFIGHIKNRLDACIGFEALDADVQVTLVDKMFPTHTK